MTYASLFTGGGGTCVGAWAAGLELAWGIELDPAVAEVANANLGAHVVTADVLTVDPRRLEAVDALHASLPCPNFSAAKTGGVETALDIALAQKVVEFVAVLRPRVFTLENVPAYRHSKSWALIQAALYEHGYWLHVAVLNSADFGVPQTRRRLIVRAVRGGFVPQLPAPKPWVGWYDAVEDLIPTLPESQFAPWQLARLPERVTTMLVSSNTTNGAGATCFAPDQPAMTVTTGTGARARALLVGQGGYRGEIATADRDEPALTVTANSNQRNVRAYLVDGAQAHGTTRQPTVRGDSEPSFTLTASLRGRSVRRGLVGGGRVVRMSPRALARFQGFPDSYALPDNAALACRIIGNACCPPVFEALYRGLDA